MSDDLTRWLRAIAGLITSVGAVVMLVWVFFANLGRPMDTSDASLTWRAAGFFGGLFVVIVLASVAITLWFSVFSPARAKGSE